MSPTPVGGRVEPTAYVLYAHHARLQERDRANSLPSSPTVGLRNPRLAMARWLSRPLEAFKAGEWAFQVGN